ncbi:MAG TPA: hydrolase [Spirochaetia bacterium]|nr:hydrolase [Spirochaetia bacterium]
MKNQAGRIARLYLKGSMKKNIPLTFYGSTCDGADVCGQELHIADGLFKRQKPAGSLSIEVKDSVIYPGLINSHDHMLGTYLPRVGNGPYLNWKPWDEDLKNSNLYKERGKINSADIYLLSAYRQILSGVTTVSDHIPHKVNENFIKNSPVRILDRYALAHECSSYDLGWGAGLEKEIAASRRKKIPFISHIEEGFDAEALDGIIMLDKKKGLFRNTVLIHCISCSNADIALIAKKKASFVWCPASNLYMFNRTADIKTFLDEKTNVTLGTDSPMSGSVNLLAEIKTARKIYKHIYKKELSDRIIFEMVTKNAARAFLMEKKLGSLQNGFTADLIIVRKNTEDAYANLTAAEMPDIELVVIGGRPVYGTGKYESLFKNGQNDCSAIKIFGEKRYLTGDPAGLKKRIDRAVGFKKELLFFPL